MLSKGFFAPNILRRTATNVAASPKPSSQGVKRDAEFKVSRAPSGLLLVSCDMGGPVSRLSLGFRAGPRYENPNNLGISHRLRNCLGGASSQSHSQVNLLWRCGMIGANLTSSLSREHVFCNMDVSRDHSNRALKLLGEIGGEPAFNVWELEDTSEDMDLDVLVAKEHPETLAMDALHKAAYRSGPLANPLLSRPGMYFYEQKLRQFADSHILSGEGCLAGVNIDHESLLEVAADLPIKQGQGVPLPSSPYIGGDHRVDTGGALTHWLIANKGASVESAKDQCIQLVLAQALGTGPQVKWSSGMGMGEAAQGAAKKLGSEPFGMSAVAVGHSDSGLFGLYLIARPESMRKAVEGAMEGVKSIASAFSQDKLDRARNLAQVQIGVRAESGAQLCEEMIVQSLCAPGAIASPMQFVQLIAQVSANDVQQAAKNFLSGNISIAAVGRTDGAPYKEDLNL